MLPSLTIFTEGSSEIGLGHVRRCITLKNKLIELYQNKININFFITDQTDYAARIFLEEEQCKLNNQIISELILIDLPVVQARKYLKKFINTKKKIICLDWFDPGIIPNLTINLFDHSYKMSSRYLEIGEKENYKEGGKYALIRDEIISNRNKIKKLEKKVDKILITMGGADHSRKTLEAIKDIQTYQFKVKKIQIIIGPLFEESYIDELKIYESEYIKFIKNSKSYPDLLASADLVFCSGGTTLLEAMFLGLPIVNYPQSKYEYNHALKYANLGACVFKERINNVIESYVLRENLRKNSLSQIDGNGSLRIANLIKSFIGEINA